MTYAAPVNDILLALKGAAGVEAMISDGILGDLDQNTMNAILLEAGKFASEVLDPLNTVGDRSGVQLKNGVVTTPDGFKDAYTKFAAAGWTSLPCEEAYGGQGLPVTVAMAVCEIWNSANLAFGVCPLLTNGAIDSLHTAGSDALKETYLPKMVSGEWTGTMNLTEPQAGSDLNAVKAKAVPEADGTYRVFGTKIFISYGEHDMAENIIHMVLARLPDAPSGTKGISLFLVPKYVVNADGSKGARNDLVCTGVEHKLGIHASPTCVMQFGEKDGAVGYLVGEENRGLATMFIMMNAARLAVGVQGVAVAERARQRALVYALERKQGRALNSTNTDMDPIAVHPDVRRMLLTMSSLTQAARCICFVVARETDVMHNAKTEAERQAAANRVALLTPIAKAFSTDVGCKVSSLGVQVHGGMGFVEETGAAQYYRDARILPIYEGTNGIQAIDLIFRKLPLDGGAVMKDYLAEVGAGVAALHALNNDDLGETAARLEDASNALGEATMWMASALKSDREAALASASNYLELFGLTVGGHYLAQCAIASEFEPRAVALARFYAENLLPAAGGLGKVVTEGAKSVTSEHVETVLEQTL
ncbi:MAG: acyl-CoA dehydrogenase C-terminal domain-containing protein [Alphaproteobacteria bacterium]|nr:acyl-CoA dehydrogenase C-terminal domain-containing protein [Alphaproteobacteria bacterium]